MSPRLEICGTLLSPDMSTSGRCTVLCITLPGITHNEGFNCWLSWGEVHWKNLVLELNIASKLYDDPVLSFHIHCIVTDAQLDVDECRARPSERADCTSLTGECQNSAESERRTRGRTFFPILLGGRANRKEAVSWKICRFHVDSWINVRKRHNKYMLRRLRLQWPPWGFHYSSSSMNGRPVDYW